MRVTDNRYAGEISKFNLAVRMIGHEARTGTIRKCTGFSEDRIRKIFGTYFKQGDKTTVKRHRGKSPTQINNFVNSALHQSEATILACLFVYCGLLYLDKAQKGIASQRLDPIKLGERMCDAYETYRSVHPKPELCFEKAWSLYNALTRDKELFFAHCDNCGGPYIQDRYALDYAQCPFCDIKQSA
ncbi:MAG: hypothetical protein GY727_07200 [Gammaproteobacteria bacterium]|nr:hypothetical protein [Gammaproteobacteria bacterium]MCP4091658.1 hypothetical protein [Gammaproteobacteria bacterium]MCP4276154.1 hypothetical protein [Gammaproteobacteria bacterium]MCP4831788.1 hypothetical protein [Gammaproteobacteria bacterium]MCP4929724.1 hypothetical protein [Gammaproteobacteria bacterium]